MNFLYTGLPESAASGNRLYPNPFSGITTMRYNATGSGVYVLKVSGMDGTCRYNRELVLREGLNNITIAGGEKGILIISLGNDLEQVSFKALQTTNTGSPLFADVSEGVNTGLKSAMKADSLHFLFMKAGYNDTTAVRQVEPILTEVNGTLHQQQDTLHFTLLPFLETGLPVTTINPTFSVSIDWEDGTTTTHMGEVMNISKTFYKLNDSFGTALIYNDTTDNDMDGFWVQNWSLGRLPQQKSNRPNIYQNEEFALIPEQKTTIPLDSLQGRIIHHYVIKNKAETQPGVYENLDSQFTRGLMTSSGGYLTGMFIDLKPFGIADSIDIVLKEYNETTNTPMEQWQLDRVTTTLNAILATKYLPNGDTLLPPHRFYSIANTSDPKWQALIARGFENSVILAFYNSTPANGRYWSLNYTYNGHLRIKNTFAKFNANDSNGILLAEIISAIAGVEEGTGGLTTYVSTPEMLPTEYCKSISAMPVLFNLGSGQSWTNTGR
jgi:hypothetical protein